MAFGVLDIDCESCGRKGGEPVNRKVELKTSHCFFCRRPLPTCLACEREEKAPNNHTCQKRLSSEPDEEVKVRDDCAICCIGKDLIDPEEGSFPNICVCRCHNKG